MPDRSEAGRRLLSFTGEPMRRDMELTGHPVVVLGMAASAPDAAVYAYLEDVAPDGRVTYLSEVQLRLIHRRTRANDEPLVRFGPYRSYLRADARAMTPGVTEKVALTMFPVSARIAAGHRLRVSIAGHDAETFRRYPVEGDVTFTISRGGADGSHVEIPLRPWSASGISVPVAAR
jgi:uncharacterized protein